MDVFSHFKSYAPFLSFLSLYISKTAVFTHTHSYRFQSTLDLTSNDSATVSYHFENPINLAEDEGEDDCEMPGELARLLLQEERVIQPHEKPVELVNLGTETDKKEVKIGANLELSVKQRLIQMMRDYVEIFAWSYEDIPGLDTDIMVHRLPTKEDCCDTVGELTMVLRLFSQMFRFSKSRHRLFILS